MPFILKLLYSDEFAGSNEYIIWACIGMMFRMSSWVVSFLFVAKAEAKLFVVNEIAANLYTVIFSVVGYSVAGMSGLGLAFFFAYLAYNIQVYIIAWRRYGFSYSRDFIYNFIVQLTIVIVCLGIAELFTGWLKYLFGVVFVLISCVLSFKGLNEKMDFKGAMSSLISTHHSKRRL
jgi:O-antigen/teichoic acid export membrane protein